MASTGKRVQRNFLLTTDQAEWLREHAFRTRRPQAEVVREALADYRARAEAGSGPDAGRANRALVERFATGEGVDLELLRDENRPTWPLDP